MSRERIQLRLDVALGAIEEAKRMVDELAAKAPEFVQGDDDLVLCRDLPCGDPKCVTCDDSPAGVAAMRTWWQDLGAAEQASWLQDAGVLQEEHATLVRFMGGHCGCSAGATCPLCETARCG